MIIIIIITYFCSYQDAEKTLLSMEVDPEKGEKSKLNKFLV